MDWQALFLTLRLASITTVILLLIAVPLGAVLVLGRSRWLPLVQALTALPLVLPPTVLGFFLLVLLGPRTAFGRAIASLLILASLLTAARLWRGMRVSSARNRRRRRCLEHTSHGQRW